MTVAVAMSGGVDSSVAALLLARAGHEVLGLHMHLFRVCAGLSMDMTRSCCSREHESLARRVALQLGIPFQVVDLSEDFRRHVMEPFALAYASGRTPNPCIPCNQELKFGTLLRVAQAMGAQAIATGHYARTVLWNGRRAVARGADRRRDQSYFLYGIEAQVLERVLFPLGELEKTTVRAMAAEAGLPVAQRPESRDVCFLAGEPYWRWLAREGYVKDPDPGEVVDLEGNVLGHHPGVHRFTTGQRQGFGRSFGAPKYVVAIDPSSRRVVVGDKAQTFVRVARVRDCRYASGDPPVAPFDALVMVRYRDQGHRAMVTPLPGREARVEFVEPVSAIAPGQAAVFYEGDVVVGGGTLS